MAGAAALSVGVMAWPVLDAVVPAGLLTQIRRNSEAPAFVALMLVDLCVPSLAVFGRRWAMWWAGLALGFVVTGVLGTSVGLPTEIVTLNESFLGALILSPLLRLRAEDGRRAQPGLVYLAIAALVVTGETATGRGGEWIMGSAETWAFVALTAFLLDVLRPWPFRPGHVAPSSRRVARYLLLVIVPLGASALNRHGIDADAAVGVYESALVWLQRVTESFIAALFLTAWFDLTIRVTRRPARHS